MSAWHFAVVAIGFILLVLLREPLWRLISAVAQIGIWIGGISVLSVLALVLAIAAIVAVLKNPEFSGGTKTMWILAILIFPILGSLVYFSVRSDW